jgi:hypothetical protein
LQNFEKRQITNVKIINSPLKKPVKQIISDKPLIKTKEIYQVDLNCRRMSVEEKVLIDLIHEMSKSRSKDKYSNAC